MIKMILACDLNGVIGNGNSLPWGRSLPYDLNRFKELTEGHIVVMGRKTFESLGSKPLPNRENVILTRDVNYFTDLTHYNSREKENNLFVSHHIEHILDEYDRTIDGKDLWIIGGMNVYEQFMPYVQEIYITIVNGEFEGDTKLNPEFKYNLSNDFSLYTMSAKGADSENKYSMSFEKHVRVKGEYK